MPSLNQYGSHRLLRTQKPEKKFKALSMDPSRANLMGATHQSSLPKLTNQARSLQVRDELSDVDGDTLPRLPSMAQSLFKTKQHLIRTEAGTQSMLADLRSQGSQYDIPSFQQYLHAASQTAQDNTDELDNVAKPDVQSMLQIEY